MKLILLAMALSGCSCGERVNLRTQPSTPIEWTIVDTATLTVRSTLQLYAVSPINTNIQWTEPERGKFIVNTSGLSLDDTNPDLLSLGTVTVDTIRVNKLRICGVGNDTKCTAALIRVYTTGSYPGFVNTTDSYGVPFLMDGSEVGLTAPNALALDSYTIPGSDRRLRNNDFTDLSYDLSIDMGNAGVGDYEMDIVIELLLGI